MAKDWKKSMTDLRIPALCSAILLGASFFTGCAGTEVIYSVDQGGIETSSETVEYDGEGGSRVVSESGVDLQEADGFQEQQDLMNYDPGPDGR